MNVNNIKITSCPHSSSCNVSVYQAIKLSFSLLLLVFIRLSHSESRQLFPQMADQLYRNSSELTVCLHLFRAVEQAADRVYMAARLFVRLFNQRGASLQHRILELLAVADAADQFHKRTVSAAVGGGVASVAGSIATITGLILAPFTFGASIIVTAVGIGVATAGSITSATANITDTVHSNMDRKKVEKMIQGYQEEITVIRERAHTYNRSTHTHKCVHTFTSGAAKAAQAISVTTGVMSALFLALDVFFLAKDSHELRKGAKTRFASKIREVCKDLQDGLLEPGLTGPPQKCQRARRHGSTESVGPSPARRAAQEYQPIPDTSQTRPMLKTTARRKRPRGDGVGDKRSKGIG
uniref:Apolipoprotein L domain containing 1a n=1 Tax=Oryzias melastigma TaxID=30732 RepID=A0A3B3DZ53_ORYME